MTIVRSLQNGPYEVEGEVTVVDSQGKTYPFQKGQKVYLCRCGHAGNKPFCDGTHKKIGFKAE